MADRPSRTFLAAPGYGGQTAAAGRGIWRARRDMSDVMVGHLNSSLLAAAFNGLWVQALNEATENGLAYFAMLHSDIGPEEFWLDALIAELESQDLDVLGVAVPIKDQRGLTSLAVDGDDTWSPKQRITSKELASLPETFTSEDVGGPLLLNTGCWVCKFDLEWARKVHFTINDRIVFNKATNRYLAQVEPEDWFFSRLCHELELKIGATRKIELMHRGEMDFSNRSVHGEPFDREYATKSCVDVFPFDVLGWLTVEEGRALANYAKDKDVLEIGSYCGRSTVCLTRPAKSIACVDYFDGRGTANPCNTRPMFDKAISDYGVANKVTTYHPDDKLPPEAYDIAFIDGAHDADSVRADIEKASAALKPGGLLIFHDFQFHENEVENGFDFDPGVTEAVNELISLGGCLIDRHETLAIVQPPIQVPS